MSDALRDADPPAPRSGAAAAWRMLDAYALDSEPLAPDELNHFMVRASRATSRLELHALVVAGFRILGPFDLATALRRIELHACERMWQATLRDSSGGA